VGWYRIIIVPLVLLLGRRDNNIRRLFCVRVSCYRIVYGKNATTNKRNNNIALQK
jgi:hypothetical protein